ncbi:hypothetical protein A5844_002631 [Enterococcus sp. 10A9_DIV0425]|uniref:Uncharacterized protein n=1 Tax=Candidatus Enterococcus wittei TaxID=1987383 RepID=A0A242JVJ7_9ENTE|nr:hypothetical protein [Enterococcus sp. 10A9_DIV0425]OTP06925.1 hypothetical protein A5844_002631 [Enterococcus sp. 10A9_DIV0425]THE15896.1 hypothetical protein E1H99_01885 [Enterococcus hirae]
MIEDNFREIGLTVVELPVEWEKEQPIYRGLIKELPIINAEASSKSRMLQKLVASYQAYREQLMMEVEEEKETTLNLSTQELLRYYDGETFDGFSLFDNLS